MSKSFVTGFPRIGEQRELKFALENFWAGKSSFGEVQKVASELKKRHWRYQLEAKVDLISVNDFSYYDLMLDNIITFGAIPPRFNGLSGYDLYFSMARGNANSVAMEMTKWFNTNYHYVVPELSQTDAYQAQIQTLKDQYNEAKALGYTPKISLIGLFTFFGLSKIAQGDPKAIFAKLKSAYLDLVDEIAKLDSEVVIEFSEPIFVRGWHNDTPQAQCVYDKQAIKEVYESIAQKGIKTIVTTFFEHSNELTEVLLQTSIHGIGLDFIAGAKNTQSLGAIAASNKVLFAGLNTSDENTPLRLDLTIRFLEFLLAHIQTRLSNLQK